MKRLTAILVFIIIVVIATVFIFTDLAKRPNPKEENMPEGLLKGKKAVIVVAFRDFRDPEYFVPKTILEKAGFEVKTASDKSGIAIGAKGGEARVDLLLKEVAVGDLDVVVFVGGPGCLDHLDNEESYRIAKEAVSKNKVLASICISPVILAKAGVLKGRKATVWSSSLYKKPILDLKNNGAIYEKDPVVIDRDIITANGPKAAEEFGRTIVNLVKKKNEKLQ